MNSRLETIHTRQLTEHSSCTPVNKYTQTLLEKLPVPIEGILKYLVIVGRKTHPIKIVLRMTTKPNNQRQ